MPEDGFIRKDSAGAADRPSDETAGAPKPDGTKPRGIDEGTREGLLQTTPDGQILTANPALARILGYDSADELIRSVPNIQSLYVSGTKRAELQRRLQAHGAVVNCEIQLRRKDGSLIWTFLDIQVVCDAQGATRYVGKLLDITDRKHVEEAVQEAAIRAVRHRRVSVTVELAILGGLTVLVYRLAAQYDWFEAVTYWLLAHKGSQQLDEIIFAIIFFVAGLSVFALRRWRESEAKTVSELDIRVAQRTAELSKTNEALHASERKFQSVFEQASVGVVIAEGAQGQFVNVNRRFCEMVGYSAGELRQLTSHDITHPDDRLADTDQSEQISFGVIREFSREKRYRRKDGRMVWARVFVAPLDPAEAKPTLRIGIIEDITERKQVKEALRQSETYYRSLFDNMLNGYAYCRMIFVDGRAQDFTYLNVNPAFEALTGLKEVAGRNVSDVVPGVRESDPQLLETYGRVALTGVPEQFEYYIKALGMWFSISVYSPQREYFVAVFDVITARKQAEATLQQSEERYRLLFENNPLPMWLYDLETLRFLAVNESAVQHYGYTRGEFLGMTIKDIRPAEDIPALLKSVAQGRTEGASSSEWDHRRKDGTIIQVEIISRPLVFAGRAARLVLASDVTEKKLLEKKFLHAQRLENLGLLAAGIAHDLNNVLAPIVFIAPLLRPRLSDPRDLKILNTLEQSARRGAGLVKQILGFAHTSTGELQPTQIKHLARDIIDVIEETFPKSIELEQQIPSDLWLVQGNPTQIHQVLLNLCVNARDAMPQGGQLRIAAANRRLDAMAAGTIPGARPGAWVVLEVTDTGSGIPPEVLAHIWEPFFTTKGANKGTGLGLSTVRGIVISHHGFVELDTAAGRGTTFRVFLPAIESASSQQKTAAPFAVPEGRGELILVVDDEALICELISTILGNHGYRVVSCSDGVEAITLFATRPGEIPLVITDVEMPHLGGVALARALLHLYPDLRLIAISGLTRTKTDSSDVPEMQKLAHAFLLKPFTAEALLSAVHQLLHPAGKP